MAKGSSEFDWGALCAEDVLSAIATIMIPQKRRIQPDANITRPEAITLNELTSHTGREFVGNDQYVERYGVFAMADLGETGFRPPLASHTTHRVEKMTFDSETKDKSPGFALTVRSTRWCTGNTMCVYSITLKLWCGMNELFSLSCGAKHIDTNTCKVNRLLAAVS